MPSIRVYVDGDRAGALFQRAATKQRDRVLASAREAAQDVADEIVSQGRADIKQAGKFGSRWTDGFNAEVTEGGGNIRISVTEDVPYWRVFQDGATINGKPLLWIPLGFAKDAQGVLARDYGGGLFRVDRKGGKAPLLMTPGSKGQPAQAKYFGKASVTIPKKFHLVEIARAVANGMKTFYSARFKSNG